MFFHITKKSKFTKNLHNKETLKMQETPKKFSRATHIDCISHRILSGFVLVLFLCLFFGKIFQHLLFFFRPCSPYINNEPRMSPLSQNSCSREGEDEFFFTSILYNYKNGL